MKINSMLRLSCGVALLSVALAGQARADQELSPTYYKSVENDDVWMFPGWANCQGGGYCTNANDQVGYWVVANWGDGAAYVQGVTGTQVSPGDTAFVNILLTCDDGSYGRNHDTGSGPDGGLPPGYAYSWCYTASGNYGPANEVTFYYGVAKSDAS